jgi:hypothetical protein
MKNRTIKTEMENFSRRCHPTHALFVRFLAFGVLGGGQCWRCSRYARAIARAAPQPPLFGGRFRRSARRLVERGWRPSPARVGGTFVRGEC